MDKVAVEVAYATPDKQLIKTVFVLVESTVQQAIDESGLLMEFPDIDLSTMAVGVSGKLCQLDKAIQQGDRVEIYRPLLQNPMDARRNRAVKKR